MYCYIFYNPLSNNGQNDVKIIELKKKITDKEIIMCDVLDHEDSKEKIANISREDQVIIAGGDGTLNYFINDFGVVTDKLYYYPCGSGNDFTRDLGLNNTLVHINKYMENLPECYADNIKRKFFNGVGIGIDGYCCVEGEKERKRTGKKVNYALIALKGVAKYFKPANAKVEVDGVKKEYKKVWLCVSMKGRFCGGGFMMTPKQDRLSEDGKISLMVAHNASKFKILYAFLYVFSGKHTILKKNVEILTGYNIKVTFDRPVPMQIDGEGYLDISTYEANAIKKEVKNGI